MPLFICEICSAIENTALGNYWGKKHINFKDSSFDGKALCSECTPPEFSDGSIDRDAGRWHNKFPKEKFDSAKHDPRDYLNGPTEKVEIFKNNNKKKKKMRILKSRLIVIAILLIVAYMLLF